jgi:uncharacterized RDD family membrane protein YckC
MPDTPKSSDDWTKLWQDRGQHQDEYAEKAPGQVPYGFDNFEWKYPYAGWISRVLATLIDGFLVLCLEVLVGGVVYAATPGSPDDTRLFTAIGAAAIVAFPVSVWFQWRNGSTGQTPGKALMGIRVVHHETGEPIGGLMGLVRWIVGSAISAFTCGLGGLLDVLWPLFDDKKRTLHDMVVGAVVISRQ